MSEFEPDPLMVLTTQEETLKAILDPEWMEDSDIDGLKWNTKSVWLCDLIEEMSQIKYPYNTLVMREAEKRLGIPQQEDNASALSLLVYKAQGYRRHDNLVRDGYTPLTQEMVEQAHALGKWIEIKGSNMLGGDAYAKRKPRVVGDTLYLMEPKKRKYATSIAGQPARIVDKE